MRAILQFLQRYILLEFILLGGLAGGALGLLKLPTIEHLELSGVASIAGLVLFITIWRAVRSGTIGVPIIAVIALGMSLWLHQYWTALAIVGMAVIGELVTDIALRQQNRELRTLQKQIPLSSHIQRGRKLLEVATRDIRRHDKCVIRPGELVPVDGTILEGACRIDERYLTGDTEPVNKSVGTYVFCGSRVSDGTITVRCVQPAHESQFQQVVRIARSVGASASPIAILIDKYSVIFDMVIMAIGGVVWILSRQPVRFLDVIVVATTIPFTVPPTLALLAGINRAFSDRIIVKTTKVFELLAESKTVVFDKHSTLTDGAPEIDRITAFKPFSKSEIIAIAASVAQAANQSIATALQEAAHRLGAKLFKVRHMKTDGVSSWEAHIGDRTVAVGQQALLRARSLSLPTDLGPDHLTQIALYVVINGVLSGFISFRERIREGATDMVARLHRLGIKHVVMVTDDTISSARAFAKELGITDIRAESTPSDTLRYLDSHPNRPVTFIGNGSVDAHALTAADVGIAFAAEDGLHDLQSSDILILSNNPRQVTRAVYLARRSLRVGLQGTVVGCSVELVFAGISAFGKFSALFGVASQLLVFSIVILLAYRASRA